MGFTSSAYVVNDQEYIGCATFPRCKGQTMWTCFILKDGSMFKFLGEFPSVPDCWRAVEKELGIGP
jgi:hypothetical protein